MSIEKINDINARHGPHRLENCPKYKLPNCGFVLQGWSRSAERTGFTLTGMGIFFDAAVNTWMNPKWILLTHGHSDHSSQIGQISTNSDTHVFCHSKIVKLVAEMWSATKSLSHNRREDFSDKVHAIIPGKQTEILPCGRSNKVLIRVRAVELLHKVPCLGYILYNRSTPLKAEFEHLKGNGMELGMLRRQGVDIVEEVWKPFLAFFCDTRIEPVEAFMRGCEPHEIPKTVMVECTFLADEVSDREARRRGHIHWKWLKPLTVDFPSVTFVLFHFTLRYSDEEIMEILGKEDPGTNIVLWLGTGPVSWDPLKEKWEIIK